MVRIRMKMMGRKHRPFFRIVAIDGRQPRNGRVIEELGSYDPMVHDKAQRCKLKPDRIKYWISVGDQQSDKCTTLFKKYMKKAEEDAAKPAETAKPAAAAATA